MEGPASLTSPTPASVQGPVQCLSNKVGLSVLAGPSPEAGGVDLRVPQRGAGLCSFPSYSCLLATRAGPGEGGTGRPGRQAGPSGSPVCSGTGSLWLSGII